MFNTLTIRTSLPLVPWLNLSSRGDNDVTRDDNDVTRCHCSRHLTGTLARRGRVSDYHVVAHKILVAYCACADDADDAQ